MRPLERSPAQRLASAASASWDSGSVIAAASISSRPYQRGAEEIGRGVDRMYREMIRSGPATNSPEEIEAVLRRLAREPAAMLEPTRQSSRLSHPTYRLRGSALQALGPSVAYQWRTTDEIDRKVLEHVQEYEKVTNRTVRISRCDDAESSGDLEGSSC